MSRSLFFVALLAVLGCGDTGQSYVAIPLRGAGVDPAPFTVGNWTVTLTRADVAFGPVYFCTTPSGSASLCDTAVLERLETATIDGLDPVPSELGLLHGTTGTVRSAIYDLGISFLLTQSRPTASPGSVDGHSARFEGHADDGVTAFDFVADVDVTPNQIGGSAVHGTRTVATIVDGSAVVVQVDPIAWWKRLDFDRLASLPREPGAPLVLAKGTTDYDVLVQAMTSFTPPTFTWTGP